MIPIIDTAELDFPVPFIVGFSPDRTSRVTYRTSPDATISYFQVPVDSKISLENADEIIRKIDEIIAEDQDEGEPPPTQHALSKSKELIMGSLALIRGFRFRSHIVALDGSLRITWQSSARNVRLVCPAYSEPYIYHERLLGRHPIEYGTEKATSTTLTNCLRWLARIR